MEKEQKKNETKEKRPLTEEQRLYYCKAVVYRARALPASF